MTRGEAIVFVMVAATIVVVIGRWAVVRDTRDWWKERDDGDE